MGLTGILIAVAALMGLSATASADTSAASVEWVAHSNGDRASWDTVDNRMVVCDGSQQNGTAVAILDVIGGSAHVLIDGNGAQAPCNTRGFNVEDGRSAYLWICTNSTRDNCARTQFPFPI